MVLRRFLASAALPATVRAVEVVLVGALVVVRAVVVDVGALVAVVALAGFTAGLLTAAGRELVAGFLSVCEPAMLDLRSTVDVVDLAGALEVVLAAMDIRFAVAEIPFRSSPELAMDLVFSSAELLMDGRDR